MFCHISSLFPILEKKPSARRRTTRVFQRQFFLEHSRLVFASCQDNPLQHSGCQGFWNSTIHRRHRYFSTEDRAFSRLTSTGQHAIVIAAKHYWSRGCVSTVLRIASTLAAIVHERVGASWAILGRGPTEVVSI